MIGRRHLMSQRAILNPSNSLAIRIRIVAVRIDGEKIYDETKC